MTCCFSSSNYLSSDDVSPDIRACAQLAVPGLNTTTPLYHQLQQYMQAKDDRTKSGGQKTRETANRDLQRVLVEDPLPPATVSDITSCQSSNVSTTATASSVGSKSSEVHVYVHVHLCSVENLLRFIHNSVLTKSILCDISFYQPIMVHVLCCDSANFTIQHVALP